MKLRTSVMLALVAAVGWSCGENPQGPGPVPVDTPEPGYLVVTLNTPYADDQAILLRLAGPDTMTALQAVPAGVQAESGWVSGSLKVALFGALADGTVLRFHVPDARDFAQYTATVLEAAGPAALLRPASPPYVFAVVRESPGATPLARGRTTAPAP